MIFADVLNVLALLLPIVIALLGIVVAIEETKATTKTQKILWRAGLLCLGLITTAIIVVQQNVAANDAQQLEKTNIQLAIKPLNTRIDKLIATINVLANKPFAESNPRKATTFSGNQANEKIKPIPSSLSAYPTQKSSSDTPTTIVENTPATSVEEAPPISVADISYVQRSVVSTNESEPYSTQVIIQTTTTITHPAFAVVADGIIDEGDFIISGQGAMLNVITGLLSSRQIFVFKCGYPDFAPDSPIVVTLHSKMPLKILSVQDIRGKI